MRKRADEPAAEKPKAAKVAAGAATAKTKASPKKTASKKAKTRYFELVEGKSNKFWEITVDGSEVTVCYGRIGSNGAAKVKEYADPEAAQAHADKLIGQKTDKGYLEKSG